jgi:hypothetical protein
MPQAVTVAGSTRPVILTPNAALEATGTLTDKAIDKLDKNRDGNVNETELKALMKKLDRATKRMESQPDGPELDLRNPDKAAVRKQILATRKNMTESDRIAMLLAQGATTFGDDPTQVSVAAFKAATRERTKALADSLTNDNGGLMGALEKMFAISLLPTPMLESVIGPLSAPRTSVPGSGDSFVRG